MMDDLIEKLKDEVSGLTKALKEGTGKVSDATKAQLEKVVASLKKIKESL